MKKIKRVLSILLTVVLIMSSFSTEAFAKKKVENPWGDLQTYNHLNIDFNIGKIRIMEILNVHANGGYYSNGESGYKVCKNTPVKMSGKFANLDIGMKSFSYDSAEDKTNFRFTKDTVFSVKARIAIPSGSLFGYNIHVVDLTVKDINNFSDELSFYEYSRLNYCETKEGLHLRLQSSLLEEAGLYGVEYLVDGDKDIVKDEAVYFANQNFTLKSDIPAHNDGYFEGWSNNNNLYSAGSIVKMGSEKMSFDAVFSYELKYDLDGGTAAINNTKFFEGEKVIVTDSVPVKEGYRFKAWEDSEGNTYKAFDEITTADKGITLKATWVKTYTISYYVDNTEVTELKTVVDAGKNALLDTSYVNKVSEDKEFLGWNKTQNDLMDVNNDIRVDGTTKIKTFTITYLVDGNKVDELTQVVNYGETASLNTYTADDSVDFLGWDKTANDLVNIKSDIVVLGSTKLKEYTVVFTVNGQAVHTEQIKHGKACDIYDFKPVAGEKFSGWSEEVSLLKNVKGNIEVKGTTEKIEYSVKFLDYNNNVISEKTYYYGDAISAPKNPKRAEVSTDGNAETNTKATLTRYTFYKWSPEGEYTTTSTVKGNMEFKAVYKEKNVVVKFYVLNRGIDQPTEISHYPVSNYSKGMVGTLYSFKQVFNNDAAVNANICTAPSDELLSANGINLVDGEYIKWYVIKDEADNYHVDGIIMNQTFSLTINYIDEFGNTIHAPYLDDKAVDGTKYEIASPEIAGYTLVNSNDNLVKVDMKKTNQVIDVKYTKNTYEVKFFEEDGTTQIGTTQLVKHGESASAETAKDKENYKFVNWIDKATNTAYTTDSLAVITSNLNLVASYSENPKYTVSYFDEMNNLIDSQTIYKGKNANPLAVIAPIKSDETGYNYIKHFAFKGWALSGETEVLNEDAFKNVKSDINVYATYSFEKEDISKTAKFLDKDNNLILEQTVVRGNAVDVPANVILTYAEEDNYKTITYLFAGWKNNTTDAVIDNSVFANLDEDITVKAYYIAITADKYFDVKYFDENNNEFDKAVVKAGTDYEVRKTGPAKANKAVTGGVIVYNFTGWADKDGNKITEISDLISNANLYPTYSNETVLNEYDITYYVDGNLYSAEKLTYGSKVIAKAPVATYFDDLNNKYEFVKWVITGTDTEFTGLDSLDKNISLTAVFSKTEPETETETGETITTGEDPLDNPETTKEETTVSETTKVVETTVAETTTSETTTETTKAVETTIEETTVKETTTEKTTSETTVAETTTSEITTSETTAAGEEIITDEIPLDNPETSSKSEIITEKTTNREKTSQSLSETISGNLIPLDNPETISMDAIALDGPGTGDSKKPFILIGLLVIAGLSLAGVSIVNKKKDQQKK